MYASEVQSAGGEVVGVQVGGCAADVIELVAYRGQGGTLAALAAERAVPLPALGQVGRAAAGLVLAVRPERWLLLSAPAEPGSLLRSWQQACSGRAAVIDQSAALCAFHVTGEAAREMLKRGCRLDLDPRGGFPCATAACTVMAQVPVILAALADGMLLLVPTSTARHFREWLFATARPFGIRSLANASVALLLGKSIS